MWRTKIFCSSVKVLKRVWLFFEISPSPCQSGSCLFYGVYVFTKLDHFVCCLQFLLCLMLSAVCGCVCVCACSMYDRLYLSQPGSYIDCIYSVMFQCLKEWNSILIIVVIMNMSLHYTLCLTSLSGFNSFWLLFNEFPPTISALREQTTLQLTLFSSKCLSIKKLNIC